MRIVDGGSMFGMTLRDFVRSSLFVNVAKRRNVIVPAITEISADRPAFGTINNGRWLAHCIGCAGGAEYVWRGGPYQMFCANCGNRDINGKWRRIIMPDLATLQEIEKLLLLRHDPDTMNWLPDEPIEQLLAENEQYLVGV